MSDFAGSVTVCSVVTSCPCKQVLYGEGDRFGCVLDIPVDRIAWCAPAQTCAACLRLQRHRLAANILGTDASHAWLCCRHALDAPDLAWAQQQVTEQGETTVLIQAEARLYNRLDSSA